MIGFDEAVGLVAGEARPTGKERVLLADASGRVLAAPVRARIEAPRADLSMMDGYAVRAGDVARVPARLRVGGESLPGKSWGTAVAPGACVRIFTGAPMPAGADRVVIQENVAREGEEAVILDAGGDDYIRRRGSDFRAGEEIVSAGALLGPRALVAAAAADVDAVEVFARPRVRLLVTGDELVPPGEATLRPEAVPDSISGGVTALAACWGAQVDAVSRLGDRLDALTAAAFEAVASADLVVVTGGASVGERDFAKAMFGEGLELVFSKVAMKPGKPVWLGRCGQALVLGLPGNPTSALVTARLFLVPLLAGMSGRDPSQALPWRRAALAEALGSAGSRETFSRGYWRDEEVALLPNQDSGAQKMLAAAELLVRRPAGSHGLAAGSMVRVLDF
jgi:molybdopterin molybdotransferase